MSATLRRAGAGAAARETRRRRSAEWRIPIAVGVLALALRLWVVLRGGGLYGYQGYDDGVYYAAAAALTAGRLPYRDFVLLHPPAIALILVPFAELGRLTSDREGLAVARAAFLVLGAINAALTARLASVLGRGAAVVAGGFAAGWIAAVYSDRAPLLEPLGSFTLIVALLLVQPLRRRQRISETHAQLIAGVFLGLGACIKAWGAVPLAVVVLALLLSHGRGAAARVVLGATAAGVVVAGPFLAAAPTASIRMIVLDQFGRPDIGSSPVERLPRLVGVLPYLTEDDVAFVVVVTLVVGAALAVLTLVALRARRARLWVALLVAHGLTLLAAPVYFPHYSAFLTVPLSLMLGAAAAVLSAELRSRDRPRLHRAGAASAIAALVLLGAGTAARPLGERYPGERLAASLPRHGCIRADAPTALIELNVLTRNLRRGCSVPVDFSGITYDRLAVRGANGAPLDRKLNQKWQEYARAHLTSGSATALVRGDDNGFDPTTIRMLGTLPVLATVDGWTLLGRPPDR